MDVNVDCNFRAIGLAELVNAKAPREKQIITITSAACRNDGRWRLIVKEQIRVNGTKWTADDCDALLLCCCCCCDDGGIGTSIGTAETDCADGWKDVT